MLKASTECYFPLLYCVDMIDCDIDISVKYSIIFVYFSFHVLK